VEQPVSGGEVLRVCFLRRTSARALMSGICRAAA
jgi:hypothetical protein